MERLDGINISVVNLHMSKWFSQGPGIWSYTETIAPLTFNYEGRLIGGEELMGIAVQRKREGRYRTAAEAYITLSEAALDKTGQIPAVFMQGLFKVLMCANHILSAFNLAGTVLADMQQSPYAPKNLIELFTAYYMEIMQISIKAIDNYDYSYIVPTCASYSGVSNYEPAEDLSKMLGDLQVIRDRVRRIHNQ